MHCLCENCRKFAYSQKSAEKVSSDTIKKCGKRRSLTKLRNRDFSSKTEVRRPLPNGRVSMICYAPNAKFPSFLVASLAIQF